jgi:hypothetical protein
MFFSDSSRPNAYDQSGDVDTFVECCLFGDQVVFGDSKAKFWSFVLWQAGTKQYGTGKSVLYGSILMVADCGAAAADKSRSTLGIKAREHYALMLVSQPNFDNYFYESDQNMYFVSGVAFCSSRNSRR